MRVNINAGGRQVEIECDVANTTPADVVALARAAWEATEDAKVRDGPAVGFSAERRGAATKTPESMGGHGGHMREVDA